MHFVSGTAEVEPKSVSPWLEDGESYLLESMDMRCASSRHTAAVISLGVPGLIIYVIGVPAGLMALLWWRRNDLHAGSPRRAQELMWFVYGDYAPRFFYWEGVARWITSIMPVPATAFYHTSDPHLLRHVSYCDVASVTIHLTLARGVLMLRKALVVAFTVTMVPYGVEMQAHMVGRSRLTLGHSKDDPRLTAG